MNNGLRLYVHIHQRDTFPSARLNSLWLENGESKRLGLRPEDERLILSPSSQFPRAGNGSLAAKIDCFDPEETTSCLLNGRLTPIPVVFRAAGICSRDVSCFVQAAHPTA